MSYIYSLLKVDLLLLKIPLIIIGCFFVFLGILYLIKDIKKKNVSGCRNGIAAAILNIIFGFSFLSCNLLYLITPLITWIVLTIVFSVKEHKNGSTKNNEYNRIIPWFKFRTKKRVIADVILFVVMFSLVIPYTASAVAYKMGFGERYETASESVYTTEDFPGLICNNYFFNSNKNQKLAGYYYYRKDNQPKKGIIVFGHGYGGGGHISYLCAIDYFTKHGYDIFAFDTTGTDNSEGKCIIGLPQQIIDMDYAIRFAKNLDTSTQLPIYLWGHSWGGYTVVNELSLHSEVKGVVCVSGFNYSMDLIKVWGPDMVGKALTYYILPYMKLQQQIIFGKLANTKASEWLSNTNAKVMFITATNDKIVPPEYGFYLWKNRFADNPNFIFIERTDLEEDEAHNYIVSSRDFLDWRKNYNEVVFKQWLETLDYDYKAKENKQRFIEDRKQFNQKNNVRYHKAYQIDTDLFDQMINFFEE